MSVFDRLRSWLIARDGELEPAPLPTPATTEERAPPAPTSLRRADVSGVADVSSVADVTDADASIRLLAKVGLPDGPSLETAISILRTVRGTTAEARAVAFGLRDLGVRSLPEPFRVACADILAARGDEAGALRAIEGVSSVPGLVLASDLYAASGQLARAVGSIERVLARDFDAPGARERHQRWRAALGVAVRPKRGTDDVTVMTAQATGPYRLIREAARGGAGAVYEAEDEALGRRVAFKVYHGRGADRVGLEREARLAVRLAGPGVVRVFDADPVAGWVAFEWAVRGSVRDILRAGDAASLVPLDAWAKPLARALARVHAAGLVHADVKPANVLLRQPNDPILADFGIARPAGSPNDGGSAGYLSPERLGGSPGRAADPRDDVYGFGRIVEDVMHRADAAGVLDAQARASFAELAELCLRPADARPADGAALLRAIG